MEGGHRIREKKVREVELVESSYRPPHEVAPAALARQVVAHAGSGD